MRWQLGLVGTHVVADALIALAYFCIPGLLWSFVKKRRDFQFNWIFVAFGLFILACGATHVMDIVTLWVPLYRLSAFFKVLTALVSVVTVVALYKSMPAVLQLSTPRQMRDQVKEHLHLVLAGATNVSIIATDLTGLITLFNSGAENIFGYTSEEMVGKHTPLLLHLESEVLAHAQQVTSASGKQLSGFDVFVEKVRHSRHDEQEWTCVRKDGSHLNANLVVTPLHDNDGAISGFLSVAIDTTARKKAEAEKRSTDEHFRLIIETVDDYAMIMLDTRGFVASWNVGAQRIMGYKAGDIVGQHFSWFYLPHDIEQKHPEKILRIAEEQGRYSEERWRVRKDGSRFLANIVIAAIRDEAGKLRGFAKVVRDITELKRTEERFHLAVEASPSGMIMLDAHGLITLVNRQTEKLFGFDRHELLGKPIEMLLPERFRSLHESHSEGFLVSPSMPPLGEHKELLALRKDGSEVPVEISLSPIDTAAGQFFLASVIDISERKNADEKLQNLALILDQANDSIMIRDGLARITYWNQGAERLYGWSKEEALGQITHTLFNTRFPEPLADIEARLHSKGYWKGELRHCRRDGSLISVASNWTLRSGAANGAASVLEINTDITARKNAERETNKRSAELRAVNKELEEFAHVASHDLKAPLRAIHNSAKWLEEDLAEHLTGETRDHLTILQGRVKRMEKLLDDLLEYARIGRAADNRFAETVSGDLLMEDVLALVPLQGFTVEVSPAFKNIHVSRMPLQQILMNLVGNAIKHHHKKTGNIRVTVTGDGQSYAFEVKDDGPGIGAQFHSRIFEMFRTLKPRDQVEGSGIGLSMIRKHIEVAGGTLQLESAEGQGSTFRFSLPVRPQGENIIQ